MTYDIVPRTAMMKNTSVVERFVWPLNIHKFRADAIPQTVFLHSIKTLKSVTIRYVIEETIWEMCLLMDAPFDNPQNVKNLNLSRSHKVFSRHQKIK